MEDGPVWLSAVLLQKLDHEKGGAELQIRIDADISNPEQPEIIDCTLTVQKGVAELQTKILEYSYKDLNLSENLLQDAVICINNGVPRLAAMQEETE